MAQTTLQLEKLTCPSCMKKITDVVGALGGVERIKILFDSSKARVSYDEEVTSEVEIIDRIIEIGYDAKRVSLS